MNAEIKLESGKHLAHGARRFVFQHPHFPDRLIKVENIDSRQPQRWLDQFIFTRQRYGDFLVWQDEIEEVTAVTLRQRHSLDFLQTYHGLCDTNLGLGMVVGKVVDPDGNLAPTFEAVATDKTRTSDALHHLVDALVDKMILNRVFAGELNVENTVLVTSNGSEHLVLVDGMCDWTFLQLRKRYDWVRKHALEKRRAEMHRWIDARKTVPALPSSALVG